jgi:hypothetical protein
LGAAGEGFGVGKKAQERERITQRRRGTEVG